MDTNLIITGIIIGFLASLPIGPVAVVTIQHTLTKNHKSGLISGLGGASIDIIYAALGFLSYSYIIGFVDSYMFYIKIIGGICIALVGLNIFLTNPIHQIRLNRNGAPINYKQDFIKLFFISLANPAFMFVFIAYYATTGINSEDLSIAECMTFLASIFVGCMAWWVVLTTVLSFFRSKIRPRHLLWINRISGAIVILLGLSSFLLIFVDTKVNGLL
ncbi:MAG: LysE family transporter [Rikenellaceae bacterium]